MASALASLLRLAPDLSEQLAGWRAEAAAAAATAAARVHAEVVDARASLDAPTTRDAPEATKPEWRTEAAALVPHRLFPGPIDVAMALQADAPHLMPVYWKLNEEAGASFYEHGVLLQYWADGARTVAEIADLAEIESGRPADELVLRYFRLLAEARTIELRAKG
jgi:hypothetical protein